MPYQSLTQQQVRSLLRAIPNHRQRTAMLVAYLHGLRISELMEIRVSDTGSGYLPIRRVKGSNKTLQPLISAPSDEDFDEVSAIKRIVKEFSLGPEDRLFPHSNRHYNRILKTAAKVAGLPEEFAHTHIFKHSIAYHLAEQGMPVKDLQTYLGHKSLASTGIYLESNDAKASASVLKIMIGAGKGRE